MDLTTSATWLNACRTRRGGATNSLSRCAPWGAIKPLVRSPEGVQPTCVGGIGVIDDAVLDHEGAHARPLARVGRQVGAGHGSALGGPLAAGVRLRIQRAAAGPVVVFDGSLALLLLGD